ncbi:hypothetical protein Bca4012_012430 [Brassica carinata]
MDLTMSLRSTLFTSPLPCPTPFTLKLSSVSNPRRVIFNIRAHLPSISSSSSRNGFESLFSTEDHDRKPIVKHSNDGASAISSGVRLENISKSYEGVTVLKNVNWEVKKGEKVGLIGVNGAGKTTQLKIITGQEEPDSGNVIRAKPDLKVSFLSQEFEVSMGKTVREEFTSAFHEEMEIKRKLERLQKAIEDAVDDLELMGRLLDEFDSLQRRGREVELDSIDARVSKLMPELGFCAEDADRLVASFSSGWQMRMSLGKILLQDPDLLLLDEPTNHLDLDTIEWLEGYLSKQDVPMVIISHDRAFLDRLCTKIVETEMGVSRTFEGNYSRYVVSKAEWIEAQYAAWEKQQKEIEATKDLISRLSAGANSGRAYSAEKKLEKLQEEEEIEKPFQRKQMKISFPECGLSGRSVVTIKNLEFGFEDKILFNKASLVIERGEKIAIIGPNGCGKSTLLKLIMGLEKPMRGEVILGEHNVLPNYFEQNQARLAFCKFMVKPSTLLVLDEPTNHLDIPSKEMLEEAINEYKGTVIAVSHDRYFIKQIVNRVIEVRDGDLKDYAGDYNYYLEKNMEARAKELEREAELEDKAPKVKAKSKMSKAEREARKKQKMRAFQASKKKSKSSKNAKRWN